MQYNKTIIETLNKLALYISCIILVPKCKISIYRAFSWGGGQIKQKYSERFRNETFFCLENIQVTFGYSRKGNLSPQRDHKCLWVRSLDFSLYFPLYNYKHTRTNHKFYCIGCPWNNVVYFLLYGKLYLIIKRKKVRKMSYHGVIIFRGGDYIC